MESYKCSIKTTKGRKRVDKQVGTSKKVIEQKTVRDMVVITTTISIIFECQ